MNRDAVAFVLLCLGLSALLLCAASPPAGETRPVRIIEVYDGDTVVVEFKPQRARVRLLDCWSPEIRTLDAAEKARGIKARDHLKAMAEGKGATLFVPYADDIGKETTLGRVLGSVWLDGDEKSLSEHQVAAGHATKTKPD